MLEPINRYLHSGAIQSLMDSVADELFPGGVAQVSLASIPSAPDDVWLGVYNENGWLEGLVYALVLPGVPGHNVHLVFSKCLRGADLMPILREVTTELFETYGVVELCAVIPARWRHVRWLAAFLGFKPESAGVWFLNATEHASRSQPA